MISHAERFPSVVKLQMEGVPREVRYVRERTCENVVTDAWGAKEANHFKCSECGVTVADYECYYVCVSTDEGDVPWSYCPNCGAKVVG